MVNLNDQRRVEEPLIQANKKLHTLSMITRYDILNLITALIGFLEIIGSDTTEEKVRDKVNMCLQICSRITDIISFTKEYEQLGISEPGWPDISAIIHHEELIIVFPQIRFFVEIEPAILLTDARCISLYGTWLIMQCGTGDRSPGYKYRESGNQVDISLRYMITAQEYRILIRRKFFSGDTEKTQALGCSWCVRSWPLPRSKYMKRELKGKVPDLL